MNQKIIPIVSVAIGIVAFLLTYQYLRSKEKEVADKIRELTEGAAQIEVVVAARDIPGGTTLKIDDLDKREMPEATAPDQVIRKNEGRLILGRKTLFQIKAGKPVLWSEVEGGEAAVQGYQCIKSMRMPFAENGRHKRPMLGNCHARNDEFKPVVDAAEPREPTVAEVVDAAGLAEIDLAKYVDATQGRAVLVEMAARAAEWKHGGKKA